MIRFGCPIGSWHILAMALRGSRRLQPAQAKACGYQRLVPKSRETPVRLALALVLVLASSAPAQVRIKDITDVAGARGNQLYGLGLVVGLDGTGSRSPFTQQLAVEMLQKMDVTATIFSQLPSDNVIRSTNISVVAVSAEIGPFARRGSRIDVTVSALDDAKSLQGGQLILTTLRGVDKEVYAVAQGALSVGGFTGGGQAGDASNLERFAGLRDVRLLNTGSQTFSQFFDELTGEVGSAVRSLGDQQFAIDALQQNLFAQEQSVVGVDINEESVNLVQYQRLIEASSKYLSVVNDALDTILQIVR